jgi:hypothetical protein
VNKVPADVSETAEWHHAYERELLTREEETPVSAEENMALARRFLEAKIKGNLDAIMDAPDAEPEAFFEALGEEGGIVEERIVGESIRSPSAQVRCGPGGEYEALSTHDQLLGHQNYEVLQGGIGRRTSRNFPSQALR